MDTIASLWDSAGDDAQAQDDAYRLAMAKSASAAVFTFLSGASSVEEFRTRAALQEDALTARAQEHGIGALQLVAALQADWEPMLEARQAAMDTGAYFEDETGLPAASSDGMPAPVHKPGDHVTSFRGEHARVVGVYPSKHPGKSHRVQVQFEGDKEADPRHFYEQVFDPRDFHTSKKKHHEAPHAHGWGMGYRYPWPGFFPCTTCNGGGMAPGLSGDGMGTCPSCGGSGAADGGGGDAGGDGGGDAGGGTMASKSASRECPACGGFVSVVDSPEGGTRYQCESCNFGTAVKKKTAGEKNAWGTDKDDVDPDYCLSCEHAYPGHYTNCTGAEYRKQATKILCPECNGAGKVPDLGMGDGNGYEDCPRCHGTGKITAKTSAAQPSSAWNPACPSCSSGVDLVATPKDNPLTGVDRYKCPNCGWQGGERGNEPKTASVDTMTRLHGPNYDPGQATDDYTYREGYGHGMTGQTYKGYGGRSKAISYGQGYAHGKADADYPHQGTHRASFDERMAALHTALEEGVDPLEWLEQMAGEASPANAEKPSEHVSTPAAQSGPSAGQQVGVTSQAGLTLSEQEALDSEERKGNVLFSGDNPTVDKSRSRFVVDQEGHVETPAGRKSREKADRTAAQRDGNKAACPECNGEGSADNHDMNDADGVCQACGGTGNGLDDHDPYQDFTDDSDRHNASLATESAKGLDHDHEFDYIGTGIDRKGVYDFEKCNKDDCSKVQKNHKYSGDLSTASSLQVEANYVAGVLSGMKDGDERSFPHPIGGEYKVRYDSHQAEGDNGKPAKGFHVGGYDVSTPDGSSKYFRHTPHGPGLTRAQPYAAEQAAAWMNNHYRNYVPPKTGSLLTIALGTGEPNVPQEPDTDASFPGAQDNDPAGDSLNDNEIQPTFRMDDQATTKPRQMPSGGGAYNPMDNGADVGEPGEAGPEPTTEGGEHASDNQAAEWAPNTAARRVTASNATGAALLDGGAPSEAAKDRYTGGDCHQLSHAVHAQTGWPEVALTDDERNGGYGWVHTMNQHPSGKLLDAHGLHEPEHALDEYADYSDEPDDVDISPVSSEPKTRKRQLSVDPPTGADHDDAHAVARALVAQHGAKTASLSPEGVRKAAARLAPVVAEIMSTNPALGYDAAYELAKRAMQVQGMDALDFGNRANVPDGPLTNKVKKWEPKMPKGPGQPPEAPDGAGEAGAGADAGEAAAGAGEAAGTAGVGAELAEAAPMLLAL